MRIVTYKCDFCGVIIAERDLRHLGVEVYTHPPCTTRKPFYRLDGDACKKCYESVVDVVRNNVDSLMRKP